MYVYNPELHIPPPMSEKLLLLEQQWEAFQKSVSKTDQSHQPQTAPHVNQLCAYQKLQQNVNLGFADWEKEHQDYQKQLDECTRRQTPQPATNSHTEPVTNEAEQMPLQELIGEHQRLSDQLESQVQSATDIKRIMELWTRFDIVHAALTRRLRTHG